VGVIGLSRARARFQSCAVVVVTALLLCLGIGAAAPASATVPRTDTPLSGIDVTATGGNVLAGGTRSVSVTGSNPTGVDLFNVVGVVLLPVGVAYAAGSAQPAGIGDPTIQTWVPDATDIDPDTGNPYTAQALIWSNIADLPVGSDFSASFSVTADPERYPAGAYFDVGTGLYANSDERAVPDVTIPADGAPLISDATEGGSADARITVLPITISKSETANAEAEIYRGPANPATFELTVRAAPDGATTGAVVVDYVPADFTVTGCSGAFSCTTEIVEVDGDVFTKLTWDLGTVDAGEVDVLRYSAYVADREITMPAGAQTGASTRPAPAGNAVTNEATLTGTYTGDVAAGGSTAVTVSDTTTVRVLDLGVVKSSAGSGFVAGQIMQYSLAVRSSQYISSSGITITDTIPNGLCPVLPAGVEKTGAPWPAECSAAEAGTGTVTGGRMVSVDFDAATGVFTVVFEVDDLAPDQDVTVGYSAYMRKSYQEGEPTASGDDFRNTVAFAGTTTDAAGTESSATNGSSADLTTSGPSLDKTIWPNASRGPITGITGAGTTCASGDGEYVSPAADSLPAFQLGDLVCFRIDATFPSGVSTRAVNISDYLPPGMTIVQWSPTADNTTTILPVQIAGANGRWVLGERGDDNVLYVQPGARGSLYILARVNSVPATTPKVTGNLAKMRYTTEGNRVVNLRDQADLRLSPAPPLALDKKVNGADSLTPVQEGQSLAFTIDVSHIGTAANSTDPVDTVEVWDVLPAGFDCGDITASSPAINTITDCLALADGTTRVLWNLDLSAAPLEAGQSTRISYTLVVPSPLSISSTHVNTAAVTRYTPITTDGITPGASRATFYPTNPVGAYPAETKNAPQASDTASISLAAARAAKSVVTTSVTESNNSTLTQATIGETVTWSYSAEIPAKTSIFNGLLDEQAPAAARWSAVGTPTLTSSAGAVAWAAGCARDATEFRLCTDTANASFGDVFFPTSWTNTTTAAVTFTVSLTMRVADTGANSHGAAFANTAVLTSTPTTATTGAVERARASAQVTIVVPAPALAKNVSLTAATGPWSNADTSANGGQTVYYRLTASNTSGRPPLHETVIVDCIDSRLTAFTNLTSPTVATVSGPTAGDGLNGCALGRSKYTWTLTSDLGATAAQIVYSAQVPSPIPASSTFRNDAALSGTTMPGVIDGERTLTATANRTVTAAVPIPTKTRLSPSGSAVPGETVTWRVTVPIPVGVNLYEARILDTLPTQLGTAAAATFTVSCGTGWTDPCPTATRLSAPAGSPQVLGVYLDDIAAASTQRILYLDVTSVVATSVAATNATATNTARISWNTTDSTPPTTAVAGTATSANATATVDIRHPLVTVAKAVSGAGTPKAQDEIFSYTVTATASPTDNKNAYNVRVVDTVPTGVIPVVSTTDGTPLADGATVAGGGVWNAGARTITWQLSTLAVGSPQAFTYPAKLALASALSGSALQNSVSPQAWTSLPADGKTYGPGTAATASVTPAFPKIDTTKKLETVNPVYIGDEVPFSITMTNSGTATAVSFRAVDTLPAGWAYVAGSAQLGGAALPDPSVSGQQLTWSGLGPLAAGQTLTITYRAVAGSSVSVGSGVAHTNTAVAAAVTDATGGTSYNGGSGSYIGASGTATARIDQADLQITKTAGTFTAGGTGTFTMVVRNNGADTAVGVAVRDELNLPAGVTVTSIGAGTNGTCAISAGVLNCSRPSLASGATWTVTLNLAIAADVASGTTVPNTATVSARTADRTPANNTSTATGTVVTSADLEVVKRVVTPATGAVTAGTPIEWSVTLTNKGPSLSRGSAANPIVLTDTVPASVAAVALTGTAPAGCALTGQTVRCEITHDLPVGESIVVTVRGTVRSDVQAGTAVIANTATVAPVTTDPVPSNNTSTVRTDVVVRESLTIVKVITDPAPPAEVTPGDQITYTLQVVNGGPSDARGVYIVDALPAPLHFDGIVGAGSGWTATASGTTVRFTYSGVLAAGANAPLITYRATLDPAFTGDASELTNTASVSSAWKADQNDSAATPGTPNPEADLELTKTVRPTGGAAGDPVVAGETAVYTFTVDNLGPSDAGAVTVTDELPAGLSPEGALPAGCSAAGATLTCVLPGGLDHDDVPWSFEIPVRVDPAFTGTSLSNSAVVGSVTDDPDPDNNTATAVLDVIQRTKLSVTKVPSADSVRAGEDVTWTITVRNDGPSDAQNVALTDVLDERLVLVSATSDDSGVSCSGTGTVVCTIGTLAAGGETTIQVVSSVRSEVIDGTTIPNEATANSSTPDVDTGEPATATGNADIDVVAVAALTLVKSAETPVVSAGDPATFRLRVGNDGPSDAAASVTITDTLPAGLTYTSSSTVGGPSVWSCAADGQDVSCELQDADGDAVTLPAGTTAPDLLIVAAVGSAVEASTLTNSAIAESPSDATPPTDDADVEIETFADLGIEKKNVGTPTAGEDYAWTVTVTNYGPSDSVASPEQPIVITDTLPAGVTFVSATPGSAGCSADGQVVTCDITSTLASGDAVTITLDVAVDAAVTGVITNTAAVTPGATPEPDGAVHPNESTVTTPTVIELADLTIAKSIATDAAHIIAGGQVQWTVAVGNLGPSNSDASAAQPIRVTDTLPAGVSFVSASGEGWTCEAGEATATGRDTVDCLRTEDLPLGDAPLLTVTGSIGPDVQGQIRNDVEVFPGATAEPSGGGNNNSADAVAAVGESADLALFKAVTETIVAGATGEYTLTVTNLGPSSARDIVIVDTLPTGLTFASADGAGWSCAPGAGSDVDCAYTGILAPASSLSLTLVVDADEALQGDVVNTAVVSASTPDPDPENNHASVTGTVAEKADLSIVKSTVGSPEVGGTFRYELRVANAGPGTARGLVVQDTVPPSLELVSTTADDWTCGGDATTGAVACALAELGAGQSAPVITIEVRVTPAAYPSVSNTATVAAVTPEDPDTTADNTSTVTVPVPALSDLSITKELIDELVTGRQARYVITVVNNGPTEDPGPIVVSDPLPAGLTASGWVLEGADGSCAIGGGDLTCTIDGLSVDQGATITLTVDVGAGARGELVNVATVTSDADPTAAEARAVGTVTVVALPNTGGRLGTYLPFSLALLVLGLLALWWARRRGIRGDA
jgi:uncharacterized repeat protein (TIGR01451 family)/fimbrial isopeptide formation D2 family protein